MPLLERELAVGIRGVVVHVVLASAQQAALLQKALDASHHALEHAPDLTRRQVRQRVEHDVLSVFLVDADEGRWSATTAPLWPPETPAFFMRSA